MRPGVTEAGKTGKILVIDPLADKLRDCARRGGKDPRALLGINILFGDALPRSQVFLDEVSHALRSLYEVGARATLLNYVGL